MARMKLHCARALPEWGPDGSADAANTMLLHDTTRIIYYNATAQQVQEYRQQIDPQELDFNALPQRVRDELAERILSVRASMLDVQAGITMVGR